MAEFKASLASASTFSFPSIPQWLGIQQKIMDLICESLWYLVSTCIRGLEWSGGVKDFRTDKESEKIMYLLWTVEEMKDRTKSIALVSAEKIELLSGSLIVIVLRFAYYGTRDISSCLEPLVIIVIFSWYSDLISKNFALKISGLVSDLFPCWEIKDYCTWFNVLGAMVGIVESWIFLMLMLASESISCIRKLRCLISAGRFW